MDDSKIRIKINDSRFVLEQGELAAVIDQIDTKITEKTFDAALQEVRQDG